MNRNFVVLNVIFIYVKREPRQENTATAGCKTEQHEGQHV